MSFQQILRLLVSQAKIQNQNDYTVALTNIITKISVVYLLKLLIFKDLSCKHMDYRPILMLGCLNVSFIMVLNVLSI